MPPGGLQRFLREQVPAQPGPIVTTECRQLGRHAGLSFYTVGQRHHLGIGGSGPWYVVRIDAAANTVVVGRRADLCCPGLRAIELSFVLGDLPDAPTRITARVRYRSPEAPATLTPRAEGADIVFDEPQRAIAPGQAVVFYRGQEIWGGGIIEKTL